MKEEEGRVYRHYVKHKLDSVFSLRAFAPLAIEGIWAGRAMIHPCGLSPGFSTQCKGSP